MELPKVIIINPEPDEIINLFEYTFGIPKTHLIVYREYFGEDFDFDKLNV